MNIIIALLLDEFLTTMAKTRNETVKDKHEATLALVIGHHLDPLMKVLSRFSSVEELLDSITFIFTICDTDGTGELDFNTMSTGLHGLIPDMYLSIENMIEMKESLAKLALEEDKGTQISLINTDFTADDFRIHSHEFQALCLSHLKDYLLRKSNEVSVEPIL